MSLIHKTYTMYLRLLSLEIKSFFRNPQFGANLAMKILAAFGIVYFALVFLAMPFLLFKVSTEEFGMEPLRLFSRFFIYYWALDLVIRYFVQQMPTQNIKPFLTQNITKTKLVNYTVLKTFLSPFNWLNLLFLIPFAGLLILDAGLLPVKVLMFVIGIIFVFYFNNFLNILLNGKDAVLWVVAAAIIVLGALDYYGIIHLTQFSEKFFYSFYETPGVFLIPVFLTAAAAFFAHKNIKNNFYLDKGLELKKAEGKTENIEFLNRFGVTGTFINNDVRLLKRSKAARSALLMSIAFLFYGLFLFNGAYKSDFMQLFAAIFVTGGFMMMFGQRVPAWDSSYYPLMMTQNVPYKQYLKAKWSIIVLGIFISLILSVFYLYFGVEIWLTVLGAGLYNLGVNSYVTLLAGAYNKQAIDLNSSAKSFGGGTNNFNIKILLLMIPQLLLPMAVYALVKSFAGQLPAVAALGILGIIGFFLRDRIFAFIVKVYKNEKYSTLTAFKKV